MVMVMNSSPYSLQDLGMTRIIEILLCSVKWYGYHMCFNSCFKNEYLPILFPSLYLNRLYLVKIIYSELMIDYMYKPMLINNII